MKGQRKDLMAQLMFCLLWPLSLIYGIAVFCHRNSYRLIGTYKAFKPVISIGNITVGGSGKTPLVIWLARHLKNKGIKAVILTRGYMPEAGKNSDEADMLYEQIPLIPVLAGESRIRSIRKVKNKMPVDVFICDDAFQHWPLYRDLNLVTIDAVNPFGNGHLLPAGILREPLSALKRADVFILTKTDGVDNIQELSFKLFKINPRALIMESRYKSIGVVDVFDVRPLPEDFLEDMRVVGFCAIGDPLSFELSLKYSHAKVLKLFTYMDHHVYKSDDIVRMKEFCHAQGVQTLVTTHKDAVKLHVFKEMFEDIRLVYIPIQLEVTKGSDEFFQKIISVCRC